MGNMALVAAGSKGQQLSRAGVVVNAEPSQGEQMSRELEIVEKLVLGIDPMGRGEALRTPKDPALDKARAIYYEQLKRVCKQHALTEVQEPVSARRQGESRAGERWTITEDNRLIALWEASPKVTTTELSEKLGRTRAAIIARLVKQGVFTDQQMAMLADNARMEASGQEPYWSTLALQVRRSKVVSLVSKPGEKAGKVWEAEEDQLLRTYWHAPEKLTCALIGLQMGRTCDAIIARLVRIGVLPDRDAVQVEDRLRQKK